MKSVFKPGNSILSEQILYIRISEMKRIKLKDKSFSLMISSDEIAGGVVRVAESVNRDYCQKNPLFICVLNGAFRFASDLVSEITGQCELTFVRLKSYNGTSSGGKVKMIDELNYEIKDRHVIIIEDIVDTGLTARALHEQLRLKSPASIAIATLLFKPAAYCESLPIDYVGIEIPDNFIVGYGLDYCELGRNLNDLYIIEN